MMVSGRGWRAAGTAMSLLAMLGVALPDARAEDWSQRLRQLESGAAPNFDPAGLQLAQTGAVRFDIPAQPLQDALASFGRQSGWQLSYPADVTEGLTSQPLAGAYSPEEALGQLLAGTGVTWRTVGDRTIVLERPKSGVITLNPVTVEGRAPGESAYGPVEGYVARQSATGSKTDTPLIETPRSISVITADQLEAQQVQDIRQALRYSAGVVAEARGADYSQPSMIIRGFQSFDPLYLDGMKGHGRSFLTYASTPIDPYALERVEVLRGPASVLYGQGQPGGLINQVSKRPTDEFFAELGGIAGNYDTFGGKFDIGGPMDDEKEFLFRLTTSGRDGDNQVETLEDSRVFVAPSFTWAPSEDTTLTLLAHYQKDETNGAQIVPANALDNEFGDISTSTLLSEPGFERYDTEQFAVGYLFDHRFDDTWQVHHKLRYGDFKVDYESIYSAGFVPGQRLLARSIWLDCRGRLLPDDRQQRAGGFRCRADEAHGAARRRLQAGVDQFGRCLRRGRPHQSLRSRLRRGYSRSGAVPGHQRACRPGRHLSAGPGQVLRQAGADAGWAPGLGKIRCGEQSRRRRQGPAGRRRFHLAGGPRLPVRQRPRALRQLFRNPSSRKAVPTRRASPSSRPPASNMKSASSSSPRTMRASS